MSNQRDLTAEEQAALIVTPAIAVRLIQVMDAFASEIWGDRELSDHPKLQAALAQADDIDRALWARMEEVGIQS